MPRFGKPSRRKAAPTATQAEGMEADLVATDGNPLLNIEAVRKVTFVMKGGVVYKNLPPASR